MKTCYTQTSRSIAPVRQLQRFSVANAIFTPRLRVTGPNGGTPGFYTLGRKQSWSKSLNIEGKTVKES